jgi:hypothetical protein
MSAGFAFLAALAGVVFKGMYVNLFAEEFLPGALLQDVLTIIVSGVLFILLVWCKQEDFKKQIIIIGLIGSLFYLYGIFTMERVYTWFYLLYVAVFASSFWSIVYSLSGFRSDAFSGLQFDKGVLKITAISSIVIALVFTVLWTAALVPLMREHTRIEYLYSIFILDLCFVMPAFFITAVMSLRRLPFGILMTPAIYIAGFLVIFPLGLNELAKPSFGMVIAYGPMIVSFAFSVYMLTVAVVQIRMIMLK